MGSSSSKVKTSSVDKRRDKTTISQKEKEKKEKKLKKMERKRKKLKTNKMDKLKQPQAPYVPRTPTVSSYDIEAKRRMQDQLAFDSETFVLNQLMLSVQFYGNYDKYEFPLFK